jgi:hypothetical protein
MKAATPEILWHGGGTANGKPDPVFSLDIHPSSILVTAGTDASVPPKGSVRVRNFSFQYVTNYFLLHDSSCGT